MNLEDKLKGNKKKTISNTELGIILHTGSDAELYGYVSKAVSDGILSPVKASGTNGNRSYPIYLKYRITVNEDYSEALSEIAMLHPCITQNGYLQSRPDFYVQFRNPLQKLNSYMFKEHHSIAISKKERSFEIFDEEKQLEDSSFLNLLGHLGLTSEALEYYETPEYCFNDYILLKKAQMTLLICENKDIWFNIRRRMYENGARCIFGVNIDGVIYGCGNKVSETGALSAYTRFIGSDYVKYLYWGDIDRAGLNIFLSLVKNNSALDIQLFVPAYENMLRLSEHRSIPESSDRRDLIGDYSPIYALFADDDKKLLIESINANKRIPQEIINYKSLLEIMR